MERDREEFQIPCKKEIILNFVGRPQRVEQKTPEIGVAAASRTFGNIGWD